MAGLLLVFLKNRGFGRKGVSNFTKSFSVLSFFFFKGLKAPLLPCEGGARGQGRSHPVTPVPTPHTQEGKVGQGGADTMGAEGTDGRAAQTRPIY